MKKTLTVAMLLAATAVFAESDKKPIAAVTNAVTVTNENGIVKTEKADAYTGATRKAKKQKTPTQ